MTNSELLKSVLKEIESARIEQANLDINNTRDYNWYNKHIRSISSIYEDIKNLSGNTVKLREESLSDEDKKSKLVEHTKKLLNSSK